MTTLREAAKQALDALHLWHWTKETTGLDAAHDALRDALADQSEQALEMVEPVAWMDREAGFEFNSLGGTYTSGKLDEHLEHFAALVAAAEAERISNQARHIIKRAEARGAEAEREACAAIANEHKEHCYDGDQDWYKCRSIEAAIRARGNR